MGDPDGAQSRWTLLFFGTELPVVALVEIVVLLGAATWTAIVFARHQRGAALLFVPYILWIGFAGVLNGAIVWLN